MITEDDIARLNRIFNKPSGGPTAAFAVGVACVAIQIPHTAAGTFFSPGCGQCMDLFAGGGSLVLVWMGCFWVFFLGLIFAATQFRKIILPGAQLEQLGAGTLTLSPKSHKAIRTAHKIFYPTQPIPIIICLSAVTCILPSLILGLGLQSANWNRASDVLGMLLIFAEVPLSFSWLLTLRIAVVLSKDQVRLVAKNVRTAGEMSDDDWKVCPFAVFSSLSCGHLQSFPEVKIPPDFTDDALTGQGHGADQASCWGGHSDA